jgi:hypothetical protein
MYEIYGNNPRSECGRSYNLGNWISILDLCCSIAPHLCDQLDKARYNDGKGLDNEESLKLSKALVTSIENGTCAELAREASEAWKKCDAHPFKATRDPVDEFQFQVRTFAAFLLDAGGFGVW